MVRRFWQVGVYWMRVESVYVERTQDGDVWDEIQHFTVGIIVL